ncbi:site-specific integrase [Alteribacter populi]|uniref:site-specific integrase n=1 Tax=Alteribacter populi TaxID=2011011 RepID=UPI000BBA626D|nr:site-specific integrase [Alteribacter populi]
MNEVSAIKCKRQIAAMKSALHGRNRLLFVIGINSGLRISDILTLRVGQVRGQSTITLREGKTGKAKRFVFNTAIKRAVAELVPTDAEDSDYLFRSRKGARPISRVQAYRVINEAARRAGISGEIGCHSLRKTFGYFAYNNGTDIALLMRIFNHSKQSLTLRYIGVEQSDIDEVYTGINL